MKIVVTGGAGFIGRYVCQKLIKAGHLVLVYDNVSPQFDGCIYCPGRIEDKVKITALIKNSDAVIHLAGLLGTAETIDEPARPTAVNITGSLYVFEACRKYQKRCCYIAVGNHFMLNTYAITKTAAEKFALMYNAEHGTKIAVVRGLNAYGPYQKHKPVRKVIPNFVIPALKNEPLTIYGSGEQIMDFIYAEDLAEILCRALLDEHNVYDKVFEAGSGRRTSINYIAKKVIKLAGSSSEIRREPMRPGEIAESVVIANTATLIPLDYKLSEMVPLAKGLEKTIEYYRGNLEHYN
jgi:UDP-glucose 4-epimerase